VLRTLSRGTPLFVRIPVSRDISRRIASQNWAVERVDRPDDADYILTGRLARGHVEYAWVRPATDSRDRPQSTARSDVDYRSNAASRRALRFRSAGGTGIAAKPPPSTNVDAAPGCGVTPPRIRLICGVVRTGTGGSGASIATAGATIRGWRFFGALGACARTFDRRARHSFDRPVRRSRKQVDTTIAGHTLENQELQWRAASLIRCPYAIPFQNPGIGQRFFRGEQKVCIRTKGRLRDERRVGSKGNWCSSARARTSSGRAIPSTIAIQQAATHS